MFEYYGYKFEKICFEAGGGIRYRVSGKGVDEERVTPLGWQIFKGAAEKIAAGLAGLETENPNTNINPKQQRRVKIIKSKTRRGGNAYVDKW